MAGAAAVRVLEIRFGILWPLICPDLTPWRPWQRPGAAAGSAGCASKKAAGQRYLLRGSVPPGLLPGRGTIWDTWGRDDQSASEPEPLIFPNSPACFCVHDVRRAATWRRTCPAAELGRRGPQRGAKYRAERGVRASATPTGGTSLSHTPMGCRVPHGGPVRMTYTLYARRIRLRAAHGRVALAPL